ncbi:bacillithiol system redox-active protein YtxJ [Clostridium boliviensis]|jgi:bacillithiol system protein YtxJ|uniref:Bacillithiol system redox-active protein YtxJ n=1 Tax=Clostridium boliviensis TaxID=318465 RepID=A0ABU4GL97_9CLOT|nr:bacillithiol system redox-active protein YtxJ [Clostridium boliviensis]MDW2798389.1 bacillithiol system redox-active protein YtxJ [Clostridium boliviensis]
MEEILAITSIDQWERLLRDHRARGGRLLLLKHSTACPISAAALEEVRAFSREKPAGLQMAMVLVIEHRRVSDAVAERFHVQHQSPQVLLIEGDRVQWHTSHGNITRDQLWKVFSDKPGEK